MLATAAPALDPIPGPPWWSALWHMVTRRRGDRIGPLEDIMRSYGDISRLNLPGRPFYFLNHPDLIQELLVSRHKDFHKDRAYFALTLVMGQGLVTSEDDFHLRQRRMIQPAFHRERIQGYGQSMVAHSVALRDRLHDGEALDMNRAMNALTLAIVGETLFSSDVRAETERVGAALDALMHMDEVFLNPFGPIIARLPLPVNARRKAYTRTLDEVLYQMIADHRGGGDRGDVLSMLIAARDEDDGTRMTDRQLRDEAITLFLAGHETTANALTWTWLLLAQHPDIAARMHAEIDAVLEGRDPRPEDYPRLEYTRRVLAESMRLYPPVWVISREAVRDTTVGPHRIPRGAQVVVSQWVTHRDPRWYPDPERFDPDRWLSPAAETRPKFAYFPFGGGRRLCIGESFAWMEGVLVLATLAQRWRFTLQPGHQVALDPHITLRPKGGMPMRAEAR